MPLVRRTLVVPLVLVLVAATPPLVSGRSTGNSDANILFGSSRRGEGPGTSSQAGQTSATSEQRTTGDGQQTNQGDASAVSVQHQTGLGGATQTTNNQGVVQSLQQAFGGGVGDGDSDSGSRDSGDSDSGDSDSGDGNSGDSNSGGGSGGGGQQVSNNQVNIQSNQQQQNVEGSLINVQGGNEGLVIVNTNQRSSRRRGRIGQTRMQPPPQDDNTLLNVVDNDEIVLIITAEETEGETAHEAARNIPKPTEEPAAPSSCRYVCIRPTNNTPYCCDDGSNRRAPPAIHGGACPPLRLLCTRNVFFRKCAHDGQCAPSDKCCYDDCAQHHICKMADPVQ